LTRVRPTGKVILLVSLRKGVTLEMGMEEKWGIWVLVVGGLNWGLAGLGYFLGTNLNVINILLGSWPAVENIVYVVVGLCALLVGYTKLGKKA
jgi:uncharacterized membrane protein YuzA (DUF378 family)